MDYVVVAFSDEDLAKRKVTVYREIKLLNVPPPPLPSIKCPINTNKCFPIPLPSTPQFGQDLSAWVLIRGKICWLADRVCHTILSHWSLTLVILHQPVADPGEVPPVIFRPNWGPKGGKIFFWRPPPPQRPLPPPLSQGLDPALPMTWIQPFIDQERLSCFFLSIWLIDPWKH